MELRELKASDLGQVCKILTQIGFKEIRNCFDVSMMKDKKNLEKVGMEIVFGIGSVIVENIPKAQKDIDVFLASLTGKKVDEIQDLSIVEYGDLIITVVQKDEFKDFFKLAVKLFNH